MMEPYRTAFSTEFFFFSPANFMRQTLHIKFIQNETRKSFLMNVPAIIDQALIEITQGEMISLHKLMHKLNGCVGLFSTDLLAEKLKELAHPVISMSVDGYLENSKIVIASIEMLIEEVRLFHEMENFVPE